MDFKGLHRRYHPRLMNDEMPLLLCDEMLLGLARWLRAAGYDTDAAAPGTGDRQLIHQAVSGKRLLLTRDTRMHQIRQAGQVLVLLRGNSMSAWVDELAAHPGINWLLDPFSRCLLCNRRLLPGSGGGLLPPWVIRQQAPNWHCPACRRTYWHGGHVERMRIRLVAYNIRTKRTLADASAKDC